MIGLKKFNIKEKVIDAYETIAYSYNSLIDHKPHNAYYVRPNTLNLIKSSAIN
jgi:hypothetical protein